MVSLSAQFQEIIPCTISWLDMLHDRGSAVSMIHNPPSSVNFTLLLHLSSTTRYGIILQFVSPLHQFSRLLSTETWIPHEIVIVITGYTVTKRSSKYMQQCHNNRIQSGMVIINFEEVASKDKHSKTLQQNTRNYLKQQ
jgi:hypothetical protein